MSNGQDENAQGAPAGFSAPQAGQPTSLWPQAAQQAWPLTGQPEPAPGPQPSWPPQAQQPAEPPQAPQAQQPWPPTQQTPAPPAPANPTENTVVKRIQGVVVRFPKRYAAGHVVTAAEAKVLQSAFERECSRKVRELLDQGADRNPVLLQIDIAKFAQAFVFPEVRTRRPRQATAQDPVDAALLEIATERVTAHVRNVLQRDPATVDLRAATRIFLQEHREALLPYAQDRVQRAQQMLAAIPAPGFELPAKP